MTAAAVADHWDIDRFTEVASACYRALPEEVRALCGEVDIQVAEFATRDVLYEMQIASRYDLLGLFRGVGMTEAGAAPWTGQLPNAIWLYRQPILSYAASEGETVEEVINHVLIHEIGHHFGLSDDDMYAIDDEDEEDYADED
jgi:predicted Zn-dependent protease with MMP-like domain